MFPKRSLILICFAAVMAFGLAPAAKAAGSGYDFTLGLLAGVGGTEETDSYTGSSLQLLAGMELYPRTYFIVRAGELALEEDRGNLPEGDLRYLTISTEYRLPAGIYTSGLFIGLGYYDLRSTSGFFDESAFGLNLGVTGDIPLGEHFSVLVEFSGHYADLDSTQILLMGHAGLAFHF